jgi:hypothetical protein
VPSRRSEEGSGAETGLKFTVPVPEVGTLLRQLTGRPSACYLLACYLLDVAPVQCALKSPRSTREPRR